MSNRASAPPFLPTVGRALRVVLRAWRWLLVGVLVHVALAVPVAIWAGAGMAKATEGRPDAPVPGGTPDGSLLADFERENPGRGTNLALLVGALVVAAALARAVLDAGIAGAAADEAPRTSLADLGAGAARLAGRFLLVLGCAAAAAAVVRLVFDGLLAEKFDGWVEDSFRGAWSAFLALRGREAATLLLLFLLGRASDAARGALAAGSAAGAFRAWLGGFRFLFRHPGPCIGAGILPAAAQVLLVLALGPLVNLLEGPAWTSLVAAAVLFQVLMLLREACHAAGLATMTLLVAGAESAGKRTE